MKSLIVGGIFLWVILLWFTGNAAWVLALANFAWMLFRGAPLFSWWYVIVDAAVFVVMLIAFLVFSVWANEK